MNKHYAKVVLFAVLVILVAVAVFLKDRAGLENLPGTGNNTTQNFDVATVTTEVAEDTSNEAFEIKVQYPINIIGAEYVKGTLDTELLTFKKENDLAKFSPQELTDFGPSKDRPYSFVAQYQAYGNKNFLTHRLDTYTYTGGAHGNTGVQTFTYDKKGKLVTPEMLFVNKDAVAAFSTLVQKQALALDGDGMINTEWLAESAGPDAVNFKTFAFNGQDILIIFPQYSIAAYVAGIIEVPLPLSELSGILKPEFLQY